MILKIIRIFSIDLINNQVEYADFLSFLLIVQFVVRFSFLIYLSKCVWEVRSFFCIKILPQNILGRFLYNDLGLLFIGMCQEVNVLC